MSYMTVGTVKLLTEYSGRKNYTLREYTPVDNNDPETSAWHEIDERQNQLMLYVRFKKGDAEYLELSIETRQSNDIVGYERCIMQLEPDHRQAYALPIRITETRNLAIPIEACSDMLRVIVQVKGALAHCKYGLRLTIGTA